MIRPSMRTIFVTHATGWLGALLRAAKGEPVELMQRGACVAVLVPAEEYRRLSALKAERPQSSAPDAGESIQSGPESAGNIMECALGLF
jgi:prevent-host-death family protein